MTLSQQFGVARRGSCWCCGGLGAVADDWDVIEPCIICDGTGTPLSRQRGTLTQADWDEAAAALSRAIDECLREIEGEGQER